MDPSPKDLRGAAAVAQTLAYLTGLAGIVGGTVAYQGGDVVLAVVAWLLTFAAGGLLMVVSTLTRASAAMLARLAHLENQMSLFASDTARGLPAPERDPWRHQPPA